MWQAICGFVFGCAATSMMVVSIVIPQEQENHRIIGENHGEIAAKWQTTQLILTKLGSDIIPGERGEVIFSVKSRRVVVVERNGVKTLRVEG